MTNKFLLPFGLIFFYYTAIAQWTNQNSGTSSFLTNVFFPTLDTGYITQQDGGFLKTNDGGNDWSFIAPAGTAYSIFFTSGTIGYAIGDDTPQTNNGMSIKKTIDGASTWSTKFFDSTISFSSIFFPLDNIGYAIGFSDIFSCYIYKTIDAGESWFVQDTISAFIINSAFFFTNADTGYLSIGYGEIYKTTDGGLNWSLKSLDSTGNTQINSIYFPSSNIGYAAGMTIGIGAVVYKTIDAGLTWILHVTQQSNPLYSIYFTSNNIGFAVGGNGLSSGTVIKTTDGGSNWSLATSQTATFNSVFFPNANNGYAVGTNGTIIKYIDSTTVGLNNIIADNNSVSFFPNPSNNGTFTVAGNRGSHSITVLNVLGETVYKSQLSISQSQINLSAQPKGIYFVKLQSGDGMSVHKVVYQ